MRKTFFSALIFLLCIVHSPFMAIAAGTQNNPVIFNIYDSSVTITENGHYIISGDGMRMGTSNRIVVNPGLSDVNITLNEVYISRLISTPSEFCVFTMSGSSVNLILSGDNVLSSGYSSAGIETQSGAKLIIGGTGRLHVGSYDSDSNGIGGSGMNTGGEVIINDGTIVATGCNAGIDGSRITINGGKIIASGGSGGIIGDEIHIIGGTINAYGLYDSRGNYLGVGGAGISGRIGNNSNKITISGGSVTASGWSDNWRDGACSGAGIGGRTIYFSGVRDRTIVCNAGEIIINGGMVDATGGAGSAGIGGSIGSSGGKITINGGTITATGGSGSFFIDWYDRDISGVVFGGGAGIGGGAGMGAGEIRSIEGVIAGSGEIILNGGDSGTINIMGGVITAKGGDQANNNQNINSVKIAAGAGIGIGGTGNGGSITIKTGTTINNTGGVVGGKGIDAGDKGTIKYIGKDGENNGGGGCNSSDIGTLGMLFAALFMLWRGNKNNRN